MRRSIAVLTMLASTSVWSAEQNTEGQEPRPAMNLQGEEQRLEMLTQLRELQAEVALYEGMETYLEVIMNLAQYWPLLEPLMAGSPSAEIMQQAWAQTRVRQTAEVDIPEPPPIVTRPQQPPPFELLPSHVPIISCGSTRSGPYAMVKPTRDPAITLLPSESFTVRGHSWTLTGVYRVSDTVIAARFTGPAGQSVQAGDEVGEYRAELCEATL